MREEFGEEEGLKGHDQFHGIEFARGGRENQEFEGGRKEGTFPLVGAAHKGLGCEDAVLKSVSFSLCNATA